MTTQIPIYSICTMLNNNQDIGDCVVLDLQNFVQNREKVVSCAHRHFFYQVLLITSGSGEHIIDFEKFDIEKGDIFFLSPGQVHKWHFGADTQGYIINFNEAFLASFLANKEYLNEFTFLLGYGEQSYAHLKQSYNKVLAIFNKIKQEYNNCNECSWDLIRVYLIELFVICNREINASVDLSQINSHHLIKNFEKLIEKKFKEKKLPKEYANLLFVTPNHLNTVCKKVKGVSAGEFIRNRILLEAKRLLINSDLSISQIAYDLNFKDNSYFSRFFKKYASQTPEAFRLKSNK